MKRIYRLAAAAAIIFALLAGAGYSTFYIKGPIVNARAAILIDSETKDVLFAQNEDMPFPAASMTKLMTAYLILEKIQAGKFGWNDGVKISESAVGSEGVSLPVKLGDTLTVRDLFMAMEIASANNAAVALAEKAAGTEAEFTAWMNQKARDIGLSEHTQFINATGLANRNGQESMMTAADVAALATRLIEDYPEILAISSLLEYRLQYDGLVILTTNAMLSNPDFAFKGVDGLKTGFTDAAGYCFAGTAKVGRKRLISVVMGTDGKEARFSETKKLFAYGFKKPYFPPVKQAVAKEISRFGL
ncbi:D-alanyl-D-alanine carboxypeptidase family protein [Bacillus sp. FJAT-27245]|uniref:D-alanyl-D-alanine carboxypeptidase family protein n=1 Tax=Bacillus sp. FJAT-27245 TaxID=1684144 RepID=UPI0006A7D868|nr:D-alanyl-D-alanine carboxypeptidase family protein [Bacillus sp. FJAT-27245]